MKVWNYLRGKKTFILTVVGTTFFLGQVWSGAMTVEQAALAIFPLLGFSTIRHGMR